MNGTSATHILRLRRCSHSLIFMGKRYGSAAKGDRTRSTFLHSFIVKVQNNTKLYLSHWNGYQWMTCGQSPVSVDLSKPKQFHVGKLFGHILIAHSMELLPLHWTAVKVDWAGCTTIVRYFSIFIFRKVKQKNEPASLSQHFGWMQDGVDRSIHIDASLTRFVYCERRRKRHLESV